MNAHIIAILFIIISLLMPSASTAAPQVDCFLEGMVIRKIALDGDYLWCPTLDHGIVRFDTRDQTYIIVTPENVLPAEHYLSVAVDHNGVKWFGADHTGIYRYDGRSWQHFYSEIESTEQAGELNVLDIVVDNDNTKWFVTMSGIVGYNDSLWTEISRSGSFIACAVDTVTNVKWFSGPDMVAMYDENKITEIQYIDGLDRTFTYYAIAIDCDSRLWAGGMSGGLGCYDGIKWHSYSLNTWTYMQSMNFDENGLLWIGSTDGLFSYNGQTLQEQNPYDNERDALFRPSITDLEIDDNHVIYGSSISGAYNKYGLLRYTFDHPLSVHKEKVKFFIDSSPNPFNALTTISYTLPAAGNVRLDVYTITGQKVATLVDTHLSAGNHAAVFDGANLASGMYFYRLESTGFAKTGKMMLVK